MANTAVIGVAFTDVKGFAKSKYDPQGRNLGEIKIVHGGVCRNVVENFANVGMPVSRGGRKPGGEGAGRRHRHVAGDPG